MRNTLITLAVAGLTVMASSVLAADYPDKDLQGVIMWGAGGATDTVSRAVQPHAEAALGRDIIMANRSGGGGAISTKFVYAQKSDGYTLLFGAENPQLHKVLGLSTIDYDDFYPVNLLARGIAVIVAPTDAPWDSFKALVDDAQSRPGEIKMGSTGPGGLPHVVGSMLSSGVEFPVTAVPYDGEGPGLTAMLGGAVDFMPTGLSAAAEHIKAGRAKALAVVNLTELETLPGVPPITADFPEFEKFLPWGPFYGVFVKRDAPEEAKTKLTEAFKTAADNADFQQLMLDRGNVMMNISGAEADAFLQKWRAVTSWVMQDAGAAKKSPEEFGIERP